MYQPGTSTASKRFQGQPVTSCSEPTNRRSRQLGLEVCLNADMVECLSLSLSLSLSLVYPTLKETHLGMYRNVGLVKMDAICVPFGYTTEAGKGAVSRGSCPTPRCAWVAERSVQVW